MNVHTLVFSPTGGSLKAAKTLQQAFNKDGDELDFSQQNFEGIDCKKDDLYIIAAPVFAGRIPAPAISKLKKIKGNSAPCLAVACYGNRHYQDALLELADSCQAAGFKLIAGLAICTEHSLWRDYAAGRPDKEDKVSLDSFASKILEKLNKDNRSTPSIPGSRPYKEVSRSSLRPSTDKNKCIKCKKCSDSCPVAAIPTKDTSVTKDDLCFACMRCVSVCPTGSRYLGQDIMDLGEKMKDFFQERKENELFI